MNTRTVVKDAKTSIPGFIEMYDSSMDRGLIDGDSGLHTVFSVVLVPLLKKAIETMSKDANIIFMFIEQMAQSKDDDICDVLDFTILEELCDAYDDTTLMPMMGEATKEAQKNVRKYILGPSNYQLFLDKNAG